MNRLDGMEDQPSSELDGQESKDDSSSGAPEGEGFEYQKRLAAERLEFLVQNRLERKKYAKNIFWLVVAWLACIVLLLGFQGFGGLREWFSLSEAVLVAVATTTTASVTAILIVVARNLFPKDPKDPDSSTKKQGAASSERA